MPGRNIAIFGIVWFLNTNLMGQEKPAKEAPSIGVKKIAEPANRQQFEISFMDESNLKVVVLDSHVTAQTKYGKLTIPVGDLVRVQLGFRYPEGMQVKLEEAIAKLGSPTFQEREQADKILLEAKHLSIPLLQRSTKHPDLEVVTRVEALLKTLRKSLAEEHFQAKDFDVIETSEFKLQGKLELETLRCATKQFGEASLKIAEIKQFRSLASTIVKNEISVDAAKYSRQDWSAWLDTGLTVSLGSKLEIQASGQIDQWPQEAGRYMTGPQGTEARVNSFPQDLMNDAMARNTFRSGMLIGRIGERGKPFIVGSSYSMLKTNSAGRLYLIIMPSSWGNPDSSGEFQVKVKINE
jgi:hypothetical protein